VIEFTNRLEFEDKRHRRLAVPVRPAYPSVSRGRVRTRVHQRDSFSEEAVGQQPEALSQASVLLALVAVVDVLEEEVGGELVTSRSRIGDEGILVSAAEDLDPHANCSRVLAVRDEANLGGHNGGGQHVHVGHVRVGVATQNLKIDMFFVKSKKV